MYTSQSSSTRTPVKGPHERMQAPAKKTCYEICLKDHRDGPLDSPPKDNLEHVT